MEILPDKMNEVKQVSDVLAVAWNKFATYQILPAVRVFDQEALSKAFMDIIITVVKSIPEDY